ncbi:RNA polymerase sigma factor [Pseudogemmobacter sonorensis]|uniref:RNA polymerase sigma factor n=1 Tax=Pseudogemmobacter sonorensis TaxID=2989681 RepID=UPI0036861607
MQMPLDTSRTEDDDALLARYGAGDPAAARALVLRLTPRVMAMSLRLLGGDRAEAEDLTQEAMLRLWRAAPGWRAGEARVTTWLYRVVANLATDRLRVRGRRRISALEEAPEPEDGAPGALARMIERDRMAALDRALATLPERQRLAVVLRHIEGLSNPEIAEAMGVGVEAVESLTARGKRALAAALSGQRPGLGYDEG